MSCGSHIPPRCGIIFWIWFTCWWRARDDANWNANADINKDDVVDIYDAITLANNYGKTA
jgi:hypothetical protein